MQQVLKELQAKFVHSTRERERRNYPRGWEAGALGHPVPILGPGCYLDYIIQSSRPHGELRVLNVLEMSKETQRGQVTCLNHTDSTRASDLGLSHSDTNTFLYTSLTRQPAGRPHGSSGTAVRKIECSRKKVHVHKDLESKTRRKRQCMCLYVCVRWGWEEGIMAGKEAGRLADQGQIMGYFEFQFYNNFLNNNNTLMS